MEGDWRVIGVFLNDKRVIGMGLIDWSVIVSDWSVIGVFLIDWSVIVCDWKVIVG